MRQVEVQLANGGVEVYAADHWISDGDGSLAVLGEDGRDVATVAPGKWVCVSRIQGAMGTVRVANAVPYCGFDMGEGDTCALDRGHSGQHS